MDDVIKRKLNILIYLAKIDGKFHKSEKTLLMDFVKKLKMNPDEFKSLVENPEQLEPEKVQEKTQLMYLALKLIKADNDLDYREVDFCKNLAKTFDFKAEMVDHFSNIDLTKEYFDEEIDAWRI